jgi:hypothetical protein
MTNFDLKKIIQYIVEDSVKLKNTYTDEISAKVEFCDIFSKDEDEFRQLAEIINRTGKIVCTTPTGNIYKLRKPIETTAGKLYLVKIRKSDSSLSIRGDADFNINYEKFKQRYGSNQNFELIVREKFEMLRLSDSDFDVMTCFSNIPVRKWIKNIK